MIDIKILEQRRGMMVAYRCESLDARLATQLYVFWDEHFPRERLQQLDWLVIDMRDVALMDASGIATLVHIFQQLRGGVALSLLGCNEAICQLLRDLYLDQLFLMYDDEAVLPAVAQSVYMHPETRYQTHRLTASWISRP